MHKFILQSWNIRIYKTTSENSTKFDMNKFATK